MVGVGGVGKGIDNPLIPGSSKKNSSRPATQDSSPNSRGKRDYNESVAVVDFDHGYGWKLWLIWSSKLGEILRSLKRTKTISCLSKDKFLQYYLDIVTRLGRLIPNGELSVNALTKDLDEFIIVEILEPPPPVPAELDESNLVTRTAVQIIANFSNSKYKSNHGLVHLLAAYKELGELTKLTFVVGSLVLIKNPLRLENDPDNIWLNHKDYDSDCQIIHLLNGKQNAPTDFRNPFGEGKEWKYEKLVQQFYVEGDGEGQDPCTILRIVPFELSRELRKRLKRNPRAEDVSQSQRTVPPAPTLAQTRPSPERDNRPRPIPRPEHVPERLVTSRRTSSSSDSDVSEIIEEIDLTSENELNEDRGQRSGGVIQAAAAPAVAEHVILNNEENEDNDNDIAENFDHFEANTSNRSRSVIDRAELTKVKRASASTVLPSTRRSVPEPLEGGFIRERLDETINTTAGAVNQAAPNSPSPSRARRSDEEWNPGKRPTLKKNRLLHYKTLDDLDNELERAGDLKMIREQCFLYGIVRNVLYDSLSNSFRLRITDDSPGYYNNILVRLHVTSTESIVGPMPHVNDIIRIHRATVQYENNEMVISSAPHHNYTLFDYRDNVMDEINIATVAHSINYIDADKNRVIALRKFIKDTLISSRHDGEGSEVDEEQDQQVDGSSEIILPTPTSSYAREQEMQGSSRRKKVTRLIPPSSDESENEEVDADAATSQQLSQSPSRVEESSNSIGSIGSIGSGVLLSELRTQSQGCEEVNLEDMTYPVLGFDNQNPVLPLPFENPCFLEELKSEQTSFTGRFWILNASYRSEEDVCVIHVTDGTSSPFHRFVNLFDNEKEEGDKAEISWATSEGGTPNAKTGGGSKARNLFIMKKVPAPTVDIEIRNAKQDSNFLWHLMSNEGILQTRYLISNISIVDHPGPFTRNFRNSKLTVDSQETAVVECTADDKFSRAQIHAIQHQKKKPTTHHHHHEQQTGLTEVEPRITRSVAQKQTTTTGSVSPAKSTRSATSAATATEAVANSSDSSDSENEEPRFVPKSPTKQQQEQRSTPPVLSPEPDTELDDNANEQSEHGKIMTRSRRTIIDAQKEQSKSPEKSPGKNSNTNKTREPRADQPMPTSQQEESRLTRSRSSSADSSTTSSASSSKSRQSGGNNIAIASGSQHSQSSSIDSFHTALSDPQKSQELGSISEEGGQVGHNYNYQMTSEEEEDELELSAADQTTIVYRGTSTSPYSPNEPPPPTTSPAPASPSPGGGEKKGSIMSIFRSFVGK